MACIVFNDVIVLFLGAVMHSFCSAGALGVAQGLVDYGGGVSSRLAIVAVAFKKTSANPLITC
ncbi:hypothetical protein PSTT_16127 [Puccinia striiformis]|uniref:Uncharacterized protein n=1 Tax=Puccinia striiformis TaxID=27350 RepID=A0A2S4UED8_9BASI|nr:hypothetical protein PSTT_16127 [Puccinia striiformis]